MSLSNFRLKSLRDKLDEQAAAEAKKRLEAPAESPKEETKKGPKVVKNKSK